MRLPSCSYVLRALAVVAVACAASPAAAGEKVTRIAVLDVHAAGAFDPKSVSALSSLIASETASHPGVKIVAGSDLQALIGFEKQKQLLGCTESSCLAELGGALGVEYLLFSEVGEVAGRWLLTINLLDVARNTAIKRLTKKAKSAGDLVDIASDAVAEVLKALPARKPEVAAVEPAKPEPGKAEPAKAEPAKAEPAKAEVPAEARPEPAASATAQVAPANTKKIAGFALIGAGAALLVGGGVCGGLAYAKYNDTKDQLGTLNDSDLSSAKSDINTKMWIADGLYAAGAVAAVVGVVLVAISPSAPAVPESPASVGFAPMNGGGALVVTGGF